MTQTTKVNVDLILDGTIKALEGYHRKDGFHYKLQLESTSNITERTILSDLQKLFDPLGWIAPVIVTAKILVQRLWLGVGWDQDISEKTETRMEFH